MQRIVGYLATALLVAVVAELLLLRTFMRAGPLLPRGSGVEPFYQAILAAGLWALNLAVILAVVLLSLLSLRMLEGNNRRMVVMGGCVAATTALLVLFSLGFAQVRPELQFAAEAAVALTLVIAVAARRSDGPFRWALFALVPAQLLAHYHYAAGAASRLGFALPFAALSIFAAEALATLTPLVLLLEMRPPWRWRLALPSALAGAFFSVAYLAQPWMVATIAMWNLSFSLFLPWPIYAAGIVAGLYALLALSAVTGRRGLAPLGLALILAAGLKLDFSYYVMVSFAGYLLLLTPLSRPPEAERHDAACALPNAGHHGKRVFDATAPTA